MSKLLIELEHGKLLANKINELEGIIKILAINNILKDNCLERIKEIKNILQEAKLRKEEDVDKYKS